jgi:hypothetical protein
MAIQRVRAVTAAIVAAAALLSPGCSNASLGYTTPIATPPPTPIAYETPPAPQGEQGILAFDPECDGGMIRVARGEAAVRSTILACRTLAEWAGAVHRYPAAMRGHASGDGRDMFSVLADICFEASDAEFAASELCRELVQGRP